MKAKAIILLAVLIVCAQAVQGRNNEHKSYRTFKTSVAVDPKLMIDHRFGNVTVVEWDKREIFFDVVIKSYAKSEKDAAYNIEMADMRLTNNGNVVRWTASADGLRGKDSSVEIDATVYVPADVAMDITASFGHVRLPEVHRNLTCNLKFGNLYAERLSGRKNKVSVQHGNINIDDMRQLDGTIAFGNVTLGNAGNMVLDSKHSNLKLGVVDTLRMEVTFGGVNIQSAGVCNASSSHSTVHISEVRNVLEMDNLKFGGLKVMKVLDGFSSVNINSSYSNVNIGVVPTASFHVDLSSSHGGVGINDLDADRVSAVKESFTVTHRGIVGKAANPVARITVRVGFGSVTLKRY